MKSKDEKVIAYYQKLKDILSKIEFLKDSEWLDLRICGTIGGGISETLFISDCNSGLERSISKDILNFLYLKYIKELESYAERHRNILTNDNFIVK